MVVTALPPDTPRLEAAGEEWATFSLWSRRSGRLTITSWTRLTVMPTVPARPQSLFADSIAADTFTTSDHKALCAFRNRLRRKAIWATVTPLHQQFLEAVEVYRPFEVPGKAKPSWTIWTTAAGVLVWEREIGLLCEPITLPEAVELVEKILKAEMVKAICAIPKAVLPDLPRQFYSDAKCA